MADSTLDAIRTKVRRLTRSPSEAQITTDQIDEYVNTFVLYDFPEQLRLSSLKTTFTFYTEPYIDSYDSSNTATELDNFINTYLTFHEPVYVDGKQVRFYQDRERFFGDYPKVSSRVTIATGDGATLNYTGTLSAVPILRNEVLFSSRDSNNDSLELHDQPVDNSVGLLNGSGGTGAIDYVTGEYAIDFTNAPAASVDIVAHTVPYVAAVPDAILFYDNTFTVRPIPQQAYKIEMDAYKRPTELLANNQSPELEEWWQYISYGAAKKILEDRLDMETIQIIMPEFKTQERLILRRSIVQQADKRVATIYTDHLDGQIRNNWNRRG